MWRGGGGGAGPRKLEHLATLDLSLVLCGKVRTKDIAGGIVGKWMVRD